MGRSLKALRLCKITSRIPNFIHIFSTEICGELAKRKAQGARRKGKNRSSALVTYVSMDDSIRSKADHLCALCG